MSIENGAAGEIVVAIAHLQQAFRQAGLKEPVALVVAGQAEHDALVAQFHPFGCAPKNAPFWARKTLIRGIEIIHDLPA